MKRISIQIVGESGVGPSSMGRIITSLLKQMGFYVYSDREYPSLIKGGFASVQVDFAHEPIHCLQKKVDLIIALDISGMMEYMSRLKPKGLMVHAYDRYNKIHNLEQKVEEYDVNLKYYPALSIVRKLGGRDVMINTVMLGLLCRILGLDVGLLKKAIKKQLGHKSALLPINFECVDKGYSAEAWDEIPDYKVNLPTSVPDTIMLDGNTAVSLGAIEAGVRAHYQYPMSPSSSILMHLANWANETKMVVKQAEDEITAVQMAFGSMLMGTRALTATSGGGFDLMSETISLSGITEVPLVCVVCQRPGPGTGLPTWTNQGDLNLVLHAGHGEYARLVLAGSDPTSCYKLIQHAYNYAEKFQIPAIMLSEKVICEAQVMMEPFKSNITIERGLVMDEKELAQLKSTDRYKITESGVSKRWIPGSCLVGYYSNGDEHREDGTLTEAAEEAASMYAKRIYKLDALRKALPDAELFGDENSETLVVGWGSTKGVMLDVIQQGTKIAYLHYSYLWPLKVDRFKTLYKKAKKVILLEGNYLGQFGNLLEAETGLKFHDRFLKYNGRPFYLEEVVNFLKVVTGKC